MLLLDPHPPVMEWYKARNGAQSAGQFAYSSDWGRRLLEDVGHLEQFEVVGYVLPNGGGHITQPVTPITRAVVEDVREAVPLAPEENGIALDAIEHLLWRVPGVRHFLLCETAFFATVPPRASCYAVPAALRTGGVKRYGGFGLGHEWAWRRARDVDGGCRNVVSVHLGDRPNVAAIKNGLAMDSSIGFTPAEGLPSSECCGDIDPAVVLHLKRAGWPIDEINDTLARHSGFSGMTATPTRYCDLVSRSGDVLTSEALEMLAYGVRKYIGAFAAAMGGVDSVVFSGRDIVESVPLARRVFRALGFPGLRVGGPPVLFKDAWSLSHRESTVRGLAVEYNKWQVLEEMVRSWLE